MGDNAAAERVVHRIEKAKQRGEAMKGTAEEGLKLIYRDLKKRAALAREIQAGVGANDDASYKEWLRKFDERHGEVGSEFTGYGEDRPWERE